MSTFKGLLAVVAFWGSLALLFTHPEWLLLGLLLALVIGVSVMIFVGVADP